MFHRTHAKSGKPIKRVGHRGTESTRRKLTKNFAFILGCALVVVFVLYAVLGLTWYRSYRQEHGTDVDASEHIVTGMRRKVSERAPIPIIDTVMDSTISEPTINSYQRWKDLAVEIAKLPPSQIIAKLETEDPFGTRQFESALIEKESATGRTLEPNEIRQLFSCPRDRDRIALHDFRNVNQARDFRNAKPGTFLFFQHLRKAGGTNFCSLASANLPKSSVPPYYCMPDWKWSGHKTAGYLNTYTNDELMKEMQEGGWRIAGNEWENFNPQRHFDLPAVFCTSFRKPLDRALSQFRFECVEDRGCREKEIEKWWQKRSDLYNVYTSTFTNPKRIGLKKAYRGSQPEDVQTRGKLIGEAMDTISRFHLVLSMEWLAYAGPQVHSVLGFADTSALTKRVRPHIGQYKREDGQENNKLGSAGIGKASWDPKLYLSEEQYKIMSQDLALDELLMDVARRMFLERTVCHLVM